MNVRIVYAMYANDAAKAIESINCVTDCPKLTAATAAASCRWCEGWWTCLHVEIITSKNNRGICLLQHLGKFSPTSAPSVGLRGGEMEKKGKQVSGRRAGRCKVTLRDGREENTSGKQSSWLFKNGDREEVINIDNKNTFFNITFFHNFLFFFFCFDCLVCKSCFFLTEKSLAAWVLSW